MTDQPDIRKGRSRQDTALDGERFGKLLVLRKHATDKRSYDRIWLCLCDCGTEVTRTTSSLKRGGLKHCGCECIRRGMVPNIKPGRMGFKHTRQSRLLGDVKRRAKVAGEPCDLEIADLETPDFCPALGIPLDWNAGVRADNLPSIDKVRPELGYTKGNVRMISYRANRLKSDASAEDIEGILRYIKTHIEGC